MQPIPIDITHSNVTLLDVYWNNILDVLRIALIQVLYWVRSQLPAYTTCYHEPPPLPLPPVPNRTVRLLLHRIVPSRLVESSEGLLSSFRPSSPLRGGHDKQRSVKCNTARSTTATRPLSFLAAPTTAQADAGTRSPPYMATNARKIKEGTQGNGHGGCFCAGWCSLCQGSRRGFYPR